MPLLKPSPGQSEKDFIGAFMSNPSMVSEYPDEKQRAAIAYSQYRSKALVDSVFGLSTALKACKASFNESDHPRAPAGESDGGEFMAGGGSGASQDKTQAKADPKVTAHLNRKKWYRTALPDAQAIKDRGVFYASSYREAEFYGRPLDDPFTPEFREKVRKMREKMNAEKALFSLARSIKALGESLGAELPLSVKIILQNHGQILILKDARSDFWDLPGGHVQDGETLEDALRREVFEETGLTMFGVEPLATHELELGGERRCVAFYAGNVTDIVDQPEVKPSEEHTDYAWADVSSLEDYNLGVFLPIVKEYRAVL